MASGVQGDIAMKPLPNPAQRTARESAEWRRLRMTKAHQVRSDVVIVSNNEEHRMNWGLIEGNWPQMRGNLLRQWGRLTDRQLDAIAGHRERLARTIRESYGMTREEAENQIRVFENCQMDFRT
jgi:uncharacterized protein YjbJ (UPF0337 family)